MNAFTVLFIVLVSFPDSACSGLCRCAGQRAERFLSEIHQLSGFSEEYFSLGQIGLERFDNDWCLLGFCFQGSRKVGRGLGGYKAIQIERSGTSVRVAMTGKGLEPVRWRNGVLEALDQTLLPARLSYVRLRSLDEVCDAIKTMKVRGAPLIGVVGAYGLDLSLKY